MPPAFTPPIAGRPEKVGGRADILSGGAGRVGQRARSTPMEQTRVSGSTSPTARSRPGDDPGPSCRCGRTSTSSSTGKYLDFPEADGDAEGRCRIRIRRPWMAATSDGSAAVGRGDGGSVSLSFAIMQPLERMAAQIAPVPGGGRPTPPPITRVTTNQGGGLHARALRRYPGPRPEANGHPGTRLGGWYRTWAEFTLELGAARTSPQEDPRPACSRS